MINIEVKNLTVSIRQDNRIILNDVDLFIKEGELIGLIGDSGNGKSVLAKTLSGIIPRLVPLQVTGDIEYYGRKLKDMSNTERMEMIGYIFQNADNQMVSNTVEEELAFGPENLALAPEEITRRVSDTLDTLNMKRYRHYHPDALSGGEKYMVALGTILTISPQIIICDEILCQLDEKRVDQVKDILEDLRRDGKTIIIIEHDKKKLDFVDRTFTLIDGKLRTSDENYAPNADPNDFGVASFEKEKTDDIITDEVKVGDALNNNPTADTPAPAQPNTPPPQPASPAEAPKTPAPDSPVPAKEGEPSQEEFMKQQEERRRKRKEQREQQAKGIK